MGFTLGTIAEKIGATLLYADVTLPIEGVAPLEDATAQQISFLSNPKYEKDALVSKAAAIIVYRDIPALKTAQLVVENAYLAWAHTCELFAPDRTEFFHRTAHPLSIVNPTAQLGENIHLGPRVMIGANTILGNNCTIHAGVVIEENCVIGDDVEIHPNAVIHYGSQIGHRCILWSGCVVGSYGFGYAQDGAKFVRIHQLGCAILEDDVELGANTTVDRGAVGNTIIHRGTKIDNLVQVAHNVVIGCDSAIAAQTGISGSATIGNRCKLGGQVGILGHLELGDDSFVGAKSGLAKSFPPKSTITGYPGRPLMETRRAEAAVLNLPDTLKKIRSLEARLKALEEDNQV